MPGTIYRCKDILGISFQLSYQWYIFQHEDLLNTHELSTVDSSNPGRATQEGGFSFLTTTCSNFHFHIFAFPSVSTHQRLSEQPITPAWRYGQVIQKKHHGSVFWQVMNNTLMRLIKEIRLKAEVLHMAHFERLGGFYFLLKVSMSTSEESLRYLSLCAAENEYNELQAIEHSRPSCYCEHSQRQRKEVNKVHDWAEAVAS